jgi:hypothetical protein
VLRFVEVDAGVRAFTRLRRAELDLKERSRETRDAVEQRARRGR